MQHWYQLCWEVGFLQYWMRGWWREFHSGSLTFTEGSWAGFGLGIGWLDSLQICLLLRVGNIFWAWNSLLFYQDVTFHPSYMPLLAPSPMSSDHSAPAPLLLPRALRVLSSVWVLPPSTASSWENPVLDFQFTPKMIFISGVPVTLRGKKKRRTGLLNTYQFPFVKQLENWLSIACPNGGSDLISALEKF